MLDTLSMLLIAVGLAPSASEPPARPNILVVVMDDVGWDLVDSTPTPTLDALAAQGATFRRCWSSPSCSPTRAGMLLGQWPHETGVGKAIPFAIDAEGGPFSPPVPTDSLSQILQARGWRTYAIGKWHLVNDTVPTTEQTTSPLAWGFDEHHGSIAGGFFAAQGWSYVHWPLQHATAAGVTESLVNEYATRRQADDAIAAVSASQQPWFCWLAFNAPHLPAHVPPLDLLTSQPPFANGTPTKVRLALEALDTELGRVLAAVDPARTWVFVVGDNGTAEAASIAPHGQGGNAKGSVLEGGVRVPLFVRGPGVLAGSEPAALVATIDLWSTILELTHTVAPERSSISMLPALAHPDRALRPWITAERFTPNGRPPYDEHEIAARDDRYALVRDVLTGAQALYDLEADPFQVSPLMPPLGADATRAFRALDRVIDEME